MYSMPLQKKNHSVTVFISFHVTPFIHINDNTKPNCVLVHYFYKPTEMRFVYLITGLLTEDRNQKWRKKTEQHFFPFCFVTKQYFL